MVVPEYANKVGCRIETNDGARAVVRYVGAVEGTEGEWIGVEWDDPTRGKHDGSHGGKRYFECVASSEGGATPGSFVRAHKIRPSVTFRQAIEAKYLDGKKVDAGGGKGGATTTTTTTTQASNGEGDGGRRRRRCRGRRRRRRGMFVQSSNGQKIESSSA